MKTLFKVRAFLAGAAVVVALGLGVYHATGLHEAAATPVVEYGLAALISYWFLLNYRIAVHEGAGPKRK